MASTVKVAVAAAYLSQVDHGRRSLSDKISGQTASSLMERMMIHSDNRATDILMRDLGGPQGIQKYVDFLGLYNFRVDRTIARLLSDKRDLWDQRDSSTPLAMVDLLRRLDKGNALKPESHSYLLDLMARCATGRNRMKALLPWGTRVEHKTGTLNGYTSDVGYITLQNGHRVAIALFARGVTTVRAPSQPSPGRSTTASPDCSPGRRSVPCFLRRAARNRKERCSFTSSPAGKSAVLPKLSWSSAI
jgi:beta-lactamase class A